jgi:hypothetical protein
MFKIQADRSSNLLTISYGGRVGVDEVARCTDQAKVLLNDLQPGFTLLTDLTGMEEMDPACAAPLSEVMDCFTEFGIKKVVRVIPDPSKDIGLAIMSLFHYPRDLQIITCGSMAEAKEVLAK